MPTPEFQPAQLPSAESAIARYLVGNAAQTGKTGNDRISNLRNTLTEISTTPLEKTSIYKEFTKTFGDNPPPIDPDTFVREIRFSALGLLYGGE